ncbi:hypothetical protein RSOLAG1IB_10439 [Rhizoctonia solani AG-1 IB]|uniref:Uncharacterized protein n=1 Tax=Thanatephorus cucumeris (strain AG1-IB / isolate 7/3/14) TaxID=1108050 RepID=M5C4F2_THACB|nr:hypothetical protein BN14_08007 [Rhizoctonia solani AG-1 IB]CEL62398.1 hypothetical protein RSOLAG1IB_10439 [Rhizoctonia solani AG-1 IB]
MPTITSVDLAPSSPVSDVDSLVFDSSSEGVHTPYDQRFPAGPAFDGAKVVASVGVTVHSPPARFVGTPFATGNGPGSPFEYPFPATRPAISNTSSVSSVTSSLLGPPSPTTRARFIPRISTQQVSKRRGSGGTPQVRVPPRLRTDSGGSACSNTSQAGEASGSTNNPKSSRALPPSRSILTHSRLRDRSGSLGVLPMILPPSTIATVGIGHSAGPVSPVPVVEAMASAGLEATATPGSEGEADESETEMSSVPSWQRRASLPAAFAPRPSGDSDSDSGPDKEASDDHTGPSTPQGTDTR